MKQPGQVPLRIAPITFREACAYVEERHRHHPAPRGMKFCHAVVDDRGRLRGVALVGRPVAPALQDGWTLEVNRLATDGCENACSALYGAARRTAREFGYERLFTYTLTVESGASLRGAGWVLDGKCDARDWGTSNKKRVRQKTAASDLPKFRWCVRLVPLEASLDRIIDESWEAA